MEMKEFIAYFADQFDETDPNEIQASTEFHQLEEWSSLIALGVIAFVKTQYGKTITGKEIRDSKTIEDLYNIVSSK